MAKRPITERDSLYDDIEKMETAEVLNNINKEDQKVALAVQSIVPAIAQFVDETASRMKEGGGSFILELVPVVV